VNPSERRARQAVELDRPTNDVFTCADVRPPQLVRQDDERGPARARLVTVEPPAVLRLDGERLEQLGIHRGPRDAARPIEGGEIHIADREGTDDGGLIELGELVILRHRHRALAPPGARTVLSGT
jgi:hypothetical protein